MVFSLPTMMSCHTIKTVCILISLFAFEAFLHRFPSDNILSSFRLPHCVLEQDAHHIIEPDVGNLNCSQTEKVVEWKSYGRIHCNMCNNVAWELNQSLVTIPLLGVGDVGWTVFYLVDTSFTVGYNNWNCIKPDLTDHITHNIYEDIIICATKFVSDCVTFLYRCVISIIDVASIFTTRILYIVSPFPAYKWPPYLHTLQLSTSCGCLATCVTVRERCM